MAGVAKEAAPRLHLPSTKPLVLEALSTKPRGLTDSRGVVGFFSPAPKQKRSDMGLWGLLAKMSPCEVYCFSGFFG